MKFILSVCLSLGIIHAYSQVKIGDNPTTINGNSILELESTNKGIVLPRVSLTDITSPAPLSATLLDGTLVFNTNASVTGGVGIGIYLWKNPQWRFLVTQTANTAWLLNGNSLVGGEFLGSTNTQPLNFKYNNTAAGTLDGSGNSAFGVGYNISGSNNTAIGNSSTASNTATAVGSGTVANATNSTALGVNAKAQATNATAIGYNATTSQSNALVLGDPSTVNVGIGTSTPNTSAKLDVAGTFKLGSSGSVLTNMIKAEATIPAFITLLGTNVKTVTVTGAASNGIVMISPRGGLPQNIAIAYAYVSASNQVTIGLYSAVIGISFGNITLDILVING